MLRSRDRDVKRALTELVDIRLSAMGDVEIQAVREVVVDPLGDLLQIADLRRHRGSNASRAGMEPVWGRAGEHFKRDQIQRHLQTALHVSKSKSIMSRQYDDDDSIESRVR